MEELCGTALIKLECGEVVITQALNNYSLQLNSTLQPKQSRSIQYEQVPLGTIENVELLEESFPTLAPGNSNNER